MALLNAMAQGPDSINQPGSRMQAQQQSQQPQQQPQQADGNMTQVVAGMLNKLFPDQDLQVLVDLLKQQQGLAIGPVVDSIVGGVIGLLKQGQQQGKTLPVKVVMSALLPILGKIAQAVETDEQRGAALLAELLTKVGQKLAQQGGQSGVLDQAQAQELQQLVQMFTDKIAPGSGQSQPAAPQQQPQPQQPMM